MRDRLLIAVALLALGADARGGTFAKSRNFMVEAPSEVCAARVLYDAERHRLDFGRKWFGRELRDWTIPVPIVVTVDQKVSPNGYQRSVGRLFVYLEVLGRDELEAEDALRHEVGHAVIHRELDADAPRWLHEGVCVADELLYGDYPRRLNDLVGRTPLGEFLGLTDIPRHFNGNAFYGQSASLVCYLRARWDADRLWLFYRVGRERGWEVASEWALHTPLHVLERQWTEWTYSLDSPYPRAIRGTAPPAETKAPK